MFSSPRRIDDVSCRCRRYTWRERWSEEDQLRHWQRQRLLSSWIRLREIVTVCLDSILDRDCRYNFENNHNLSPPDCTCPFANIHILHTQAWHLLELQLQRETNEVINHIATRIFLFFLTNIRCSRIHINYQGLQDIAVVVCQTSIEYRISKCQSLCCVERNIHRDHYLNLR